MNSWVEFRYVNGKLFEETLPVASFNKKMREPLLDATALDWSLISPAIFGSLFQSIMDKEARRNLGAHYTREANIMKALKSLFLNDLHEELDTIGNKATDLSELGQAGHLVHLWPAAGIQLNNLDCAWIGP